MCLIRLSIEAQTVLAADHNLFRSRTDFGIYAEREAALMKAEIEALEKEAAA